MFDAILSSLTLHYLAEWIQPLREFARVLRPRGRLVVSTHHPVDDAADDNVVREVEKVWSGFEQSVRMRFFHRPLERIAGNIVAAGFALCALREPTVTADAVRIDPAVRAC